MVVDACTEEDIAREASWIQESMTAVLNQFAKPIRVCSCSKRWWQAEVKLARGTYTQARRAWQTGTLGDREHREARNTYYRAIRRAKRECWEAFLIGPMETGDLLGPEDATRCWQALRYTTPKAASTTPTLRGVMSQQEITLSNTAMQDETITPQGSNRANSRSRDKNEH
ncbi:reverse transcriptase [Rasamsonia emersonii CBS 393.64]|uniref:Reverse transcriptase n=1 Tax=Rasamsonia emersonii (strain ATCC 16479 / CBS 393.64 / IMI 116815) TaxID=1408163 RepID=A0A0F4YQP0_RASE3|nr:reverse transcriptase [Rasamsonia emersonii CBS 393.64]KKA20574.1 reverse transcriptase [Rasamsonia emersonii CBS 393.64]